MNSKLLLSLFSLLFIYGCGSQPSTATLKVSSSFLATNSSFAGGLIIRGTSPSLGDFSVSLPRSASGSDQIQIQLPKGLWTFYATAWNGAANFTGNVFCGTSTANLVDAQATVDINVTQTGCTAFAEAQALLPSPVNGNMLRDFSLSSCEAFYEHSTNSFALISTATPASYCDSIYMPKDMTSSVKSFKIIAPTKTLGSLVSVGFESSCFSASGSSVINAANVKLPTRFIPFVVKIYEEANCSENDLITTHAMHEGLSTAYSGVDKILLKTSPSASARVSLHVPSNQIKKGYSPFYHILPEFKCAEGDCIHSKPGSHYYVKPGSNPGSFIDFVLDYSSGENKCAYYSNYISVTEGNGNDFSVECKEQSDRVYVQIPSNIVVPNTDITLQYSKNGAEISKTISVLSNNQEFDALRLGWELVGKNPSAAEIVHSSSNGNHKSDKRDLYGALGKVREMLGPGGPGGLFGKPGTLPVPGDCSTINGTQIISFDDRKDGGTNTYQVIVDPVLAAGHIFDMNTFFCKSNSYSSGCTSSDSLYDRRLRAYKLIGPGNYQLEIVVKFSCSQRAGILMDKDDETKADGIFHRSKSVVIWNTPVTNPGYQRFETYSSSSHSDGSTTWENTRVARVYKGDASGNIFQIDGSDYNKTLPYADPSIFTEYASRYFMSRDAADTFQGYLLQLTGDQSAAISNNYTSPLNFNVRINPSSPNDGTINSPDPTWNSSLVPAALVLKYGTTTQAPFTNSINGIKPSIMNAQLGVLTDPDSPFIPQP